MKFTTAAVLASAALAAADTVDFTGHKVFRLIPKGDNFRESFTALAEELDLSIWQRPARHGSSADVAVSPSKLRSFKEGIKTWADVQVMHEDLQRSIDEESRFQVYQPGTANATWFNSYHKYSDHVTWLKEIQNQYSAHSELFNVGESVEGRNITGIHIFGNNKGVKPAIVFQGHVHAREWIASMTVEYIIFQLLSQYDTDSEVSAMLDKFDLYITPIGNPDGFVYSQEKSRMWRKNRRVNRNSSCVGVDPNRNFPVDWQGSTNDPCDETFRGASEASEPEVQGLMGVVKNAVEKQGVKLFVDYHSYSQVMCVPYGYDCDTSPDNEAALSKLAEGTVKAIGSSSGTKYEAGNTCKVVGASSGGSDDWSLKYGGAEYAYTIELRDTGDYGFVLPPEQILPTGKENWEGVKYMINNL